MASPVHSAAYRAKNREKLNQQSREYRKTERGRAKYNAWQAANREKLSTRVWERKILREFGLTAADYDERLKNQRGVCLICEEPPKGKRLAVDHNHRTGRVRALLCDRCNFMVGRYEDDSWKWWNKVFVYLITNDY